MNCRITSYSSGERLDTVEMIVLARAYQIAWRSLFAAEPVGQHVIAQLDAVFLFYPEPRLL